MIAIAPTGWSWFQQLRAEGVTRNVNFWTPTPWHLRRLRPGDRLYFMLKAPRRKIGGFGVFRRYENMPVELAWNEFGRGNGVASLSDMVDRLKSYRNKRATARSSDNNSAIGCIVLDDCSFLEDTDFINPGERRVGIS